MDGRALDRVRLIAAISQRGMLYLSSRPSTEPQFSGHNKDTLVRLERDGGIVDVEEV